MGAVTRRAATTEPPPMRVCRKRLRGYPSGWPLLWGPHPFENLQRTGGKSRPRETERRRGTLYGLLVPSERGGVYRRRT